MDVRDRAYAAGLIDGEGTITMTRVDSPWRCPVVSVPSTSYELLIRMRRLFGGSISEKMPEAGCKRSWIWAVRRVAAISCLEQVVEFLVERKKKARAEFILDGYVRTTKRNGKYSHDELTAKYKFEREFFELSVPAMSTEERT